MRALFLSLVAVTLQAQIPAARSSVIQDIDEQSKHFGDVSRQIWEWAEVGYQEVKSAALLKEELRKAGFTIEDQIAGIPTAFSATFGQGKPVIGIMGEYDALPELSQDSVPVQKPLAAGRAGHGCGHNLFGAGAALAAIAVKDYLSSRKQPGTIVFYGTPAEEGGAGKVFMTRAGAFQKCDAMLTWHPGDKNRAVNGSSLANINAKFQFRGKASHAAAAPDRGRSALDGLILMAHCVDMLREHVPQETRIHYTITNGGGAPNVVPAFAEGYFYARQQSMSILDDVWSRIGKCGQAGALGTGTQVEEKISASVYNLLPNAPLAELLDKNLRGVGGIPYTSEERAFAEQLRQSFSTSDPIESAGHVQAISAEGLGGSTDVADVSWAVPTGQFTTATAVPGTPGHSWQNVACAGSSIGRKGMINAAKVLALSTLDLMDSPAQLEAARKAFDQARDGKEYRSRLPAGAKPPLNYRK